MANASEGQLRISSGVKGLDEVLMGGFIQGGLYIIEGEPGTGKTILANQLCFNQIKLGKTVLYVTLIAETVARMLVNLRYMQFFDEHAIGTTLVYVSAFTALKDEGLTGLLHLLRREVAARGASIVIVDGFASASASAKSSEEIKVFVQQLQTQADISNSTVFLLTNPCETGPSAEETMVDGIIKISNKLQGSSVLREFYVRKFRGSAYLEGIHNYRIGEDGITIYPRMEMRSNQLPMDNGAMQRMPSGISECDVMLGGGLPINSMTMLVGPSGSGKTTVGLQFLSLASAHEPGLLFGFYETPARIRAKTAMFPSFARALIAEEIEILWQPPTEYLLDELADRLLQTVKRRKVRRLVIDGLAGFTKALRSRPMEPFFAALVEELRREKVTTICTAEVPEIIGPTITEPLGGLSDVTDNHIVLRFIEAEASLHRLVSILKVRDAAFDSGLRLFSIGASGVEVATDTRGAKDALAQSFPRIRQPILIASDK
jgi:circadian clock protein KaiC